MEKINTPLGENIERLIYEISKIAQHEGNNISPYMSNKLEFLRAELKENQKLLPTERDIIVKTYSAGQDNYRQFTLDRLNNRLTYDEQYFNQNFKSYE